jgi:hypothetical protein
MHAEHVVCVIRRNGVRIPTASLTATLSTTFGTNVAANCIDGIADDNINIW